MSQTKFLCAKEVAQLLGVSLKWVYAHQQEIPGRIKIAGLIRWDETILLNSVKEQAAQKPRICHTFASRGQGSGERKDRHKLLAL